MKKILLIILSILLFALSCGQKENSEGEQKKTEKLKVAATPIPA